MAYVAVRGGEQAIQQAEQFFQQLNGPIDAAIAHLNSRGVAVELGPVARYGARDAGMSVYFRDPDGSLLEFIAYS